MATKRGKPWPPAGRFNGRLWGGSHGHRQKLTAAGCRRMRSPPGCRGDRIWHGAITPRRLTWLLLLGDCDSAPEFAGPPIPNKHEQVLRRHGPHWGSPRSRSPRCRFARRSGHPIAAGTRAAPTGPTRKRFQGRSRLMLWRLGRLLGAPVRANAGVSRSELRVDPSRPSSPLDACPTAPLKLTTVVASAAALTM